MCDFTTSLSAALIHTGSAGDFNSLIYSNIEEGFIRLKARLSACTPYLLRVRFILFKSSFIFNKLSLKYFEALF